MRRFAIVAGLTVLAAWLLAGQPVAARVWAALMLVALPAVAFAQARLLEGEEALPVLPAYLSTIGFLVVLGAITALVARAAGFDADALGVRPLDSLPTVAWASGATLAALGLIEAARALGLRETSTTRQLLPVTPTQRIVYVLVSFSAGVFEEFAYRGFLLTVLAAASGSVVFATVASAIAFGGVHGYQAGGGVLRATALGLLLTVPVLATGSLLPSVLAHAAIDLLAGFVLADRLRA